MTDISLPPDGTQIIAMTYESIEYDRESVAISGPLTTRYVESLNYIQCWIGDTQVNPATVKAEGVTE